MLAALKFVQGAVARKDFVPALIHYSIARGTIRSFNGAVALCCPVPLDLDVTPRADVFAKAIEACTDVAQLSLTPEKKLLIKSGKFQIHVDCLDEPFPNVHPEGRKVELDGHLLEAIKKLAPCIAEDASRKWAQGILLRGPSAFATNNVILAEYWLGYNFPVEVNISKLAVQELLRIGEEPVAIQVSEESMTFHYAGQRWLRAQNSPTTWPDVGAILDTTEPAWWNLKEEFYEALDHLAPFVDDLGQIFFCGNCLSTVPAGGRGALVEVETPATGIYHVGQLRLLRSLGADAADWRYPSPSLFYGPKVRGAIVGIRG